MSYEPIENYGIIGNMRMVLHERAGYSYAGNLE
jgi:hypothetical protein